MCSILLDAFFCFIQHSYINIVNWSFNFPFCYFNLHKTDQKGYQKRQDREHNNTCNRTEHLLLGDMFKMIRSLIVNKDHLYMQ